MKLLFLGIYAPTYSSDAMVRGFQKNGFNVDVIDWQHLKFECGRMAQNLAEMHSGTVIFRNTIIAKVIEKKYDYVFMQIQNNEIFDMDTIMVMRQYSKLVNYTFDVREEKRMKWMYEFAPFMHLTVFACMENVSHCIKKGIFNVACLQSSCDMETYVPYHVPYRIDDTPEIIFLGNNYQNTSLGFEQATYRQDMVNFLKEQYGDRFGAYGLNGMPNGPTKHIQQEVNLYNSCKIAISQNNYKRELYTSDRLWRIMACGAFCMTERFKGMELMFSEGIHLEGWDDFDELKEKIDHYLINDGEREKIAAGGCSLVRSHHRWEDRFRILKELLLNYAI